MDGCPAHAFRASAALPLFHRDINFNGCSEVAEQWVRYSKTRSAGRTQPAGMDDSKAMVLTRQRRMQKRLCGRNIAQLITWSLLCSSFSDTTLIHCAMLSRPKILQQQDNAVVTADGIRAEHKHVGRSAQLAVQHQYQVLITLQ